MFKEFGRFFFDLVASGGMNDFALDLQETIGSVKHSCTESKGIYPFKHQQQTSPFNLWPATGCEKHGVHSSKTSYFVCGTSVSLCSLIQRTSKHLEHNFSAHFCGQAINHACSFSSFQLNSVLGFNEIDHQKTDTKRRITKRKIKQLMPTWETTGKYIHSDVLLELRIDQFQHLPSIPILPPPPSAEDSFAHWTSASQSCPELMCGTAWRNWQVISCYSAQAEGRGPES